MSTSPGLSRPRLLQELEAIESRYPQLAIRGLEPPTFDGVLEIEGEPHRVQLRLPLGYPSLPPEVRELDLQSGEELLGWGRPHWLPDTGFCLFPHGHLEQSWRRDRLAVDAIDKFHEYVRSEPSLASGISTAPDRIYLPSESLARLAKVQTCTLLAHRALRGGDYYVTHLSWSEDTAECCVGDFGNWLEFLRARIAVPWLLVKSEDAWNRVLANPDVDTVLEVVEQEISETSISLHVGQPIVIGRISGGNLDAICLLYSLFPIGVFQIPVVIGSPSQALFNRVDGVLSRRDRLQDEMVFMIGVGSLGGAIAVALARAGLRNFVLIDPDRLTAENVCRHVGTLGDLGRAKVEIVAETITKVNPDAHVQYVAKPLAWDLPWIGAGMDFEQLLAQAANPIVVTTCAVHMTELQLNTFAVRAGVPVIYASALGAAEHGRVFRVLPNETPCYECIIAAQDAYPADYPRFSVDGRDTERRPAYIDPSLPGLGIDLTELAMITARFALQTIAQVRGLDLGLPPAGGDHLLWTSRGGWVFDCSLQLTIERFSRAPDCPVCGEGAQRAELDAAGQEQLDALIAKLQHR